MLSCPKSIPSSIKKYCAADTTGLFTGVYYRAPFAAFPVPSVTGTAGIADNVGAMVRVERLTLASFGVWTLAFELWLDGANVDPNDQTTNPNVERH